MSSGNVNHTATSFPYLPLLRQLSYSIYTYPCIYWCHILLYSYTYTHLYKTYVSTLNDLPIPGVFSVTAQVRDGLRLRGAAYGEQEEYLPVAVLQVLPDVVRYLPL